MIGNQLWDECIFGFVMIVIGAAFAWFMAGHSILLALVGVANFFFGLYVIWGAMAWRKYKDETWQKHGRKAPSTPEKPFP